MEHLSKIINSINDGLHKSRFGALLLALLLGYSLYLGAPILSGWLNVKKAVDIKKIETGPNNSGTYRVKGATE
jgi:hypothetical protein